MRSPLGVCSYSFLYSCSLERKCLDVSRANGFVVTMQPRRARSVRLAGYKARAIGRFEKRAVNDGVFAELDLAPSWAFGLVTNYGMAALTDSVKVGARKGDSAFAGPGGHFRLVILASAKRRIS